MCSWNWQLYPPFKEQDTYIHHCIHWDNTNILDKAYRNDELLIKEAMHILLVTKNMIMNRDEGIELLGCLIKAVCGTIPPA